LLASNAWSTSWMSCPVSGQHTTRTCHLKAGTSMCRRSRLSSRATSPGRSRKYWRMKPPHRGAQGRFHLCRRTNHVVFGDPGHFQVATLGLDSVKYLAADHVLAEEVTVLAVLIRPA